MKNKLIYNYLVDFKKKEISYLERAKLIQEYLDTNNISQRALAKELDMPHSTIHDWLMWNKLTEEDYKDMKEQGLNDTKIYRALRNGQYDDREKIVSSCLLDTQIEDSIKNLKSYVFLKELKTSIRTRKLLDELYQILNEILLQVKK